MNIFREIDLKICQLKRARNRQAKFQEYNNLILQLNLRLFKVKRLEETNWERMIGPTEAKKRRQLIKNSN